MTAGKIQALPLLLQISKHAHAITVLDKNINW